MKPGPFVAMAALIVVGMVLVIQPTLSQQRQTTEGAMHFRLTLGSRKVLAEQRVDPDDPSRWTYRFVDWPAGGSAWMDATQFEARCREELRAWQHRPAPVKLLFGFFNISSWASFWWIALGLGGQTCFFGRMLIQWVMSEKRRRSLVPELYWWLSLFGGMSLFVYFVWRVDIVGVLGQSTGVVVYARNLRLIHKSRRRRARERGPAGRRAG